MGLCIQERRAGVILDELLLLVYLFVRNDGVEWDA